MICFLVFSSGLSDASMGCCRRLIRGCDADELRPPRVDRRPAVVVAAAAVVVAVVDDEVFRVFDCFSRSSKST